MSRIYQALGFHSCWLSTMDIQELNLIVVNPPSNCNDTTHLAMGV